MLRKENVEEAVLFDLDPCLVSTLLCFKEAIGTQPPVCGLVPARGPGPTRKTQLGDVILNYKETGPQLSRVEPKVHNTFIFTSRPNP